MAKTTSFARSENKTRLSVEPNDLHSNQIFHYAGYITCNELARPVSASLRPKTQFRLRKYGSGGEPLATVCPI